MCFGSQEVRPCNRPSTSTNPGPGSYFEQTFTDKLQRERENQLIAEKNDVKVDGFGSNAERVMYWCAAKPGPAPGQYDSNIDMADATADLKVIGKEPKARVRTACDVERRKRHSTFTSTTNRIEANLAKDPNVRLLTSAKGPKKTYAFTSKDLRAHQIPSSAIGIENKITCANYSSQGQPDWIKQTRARDTCLSIGRPISFEATSPRFKYNEALFGHSLKTDIPGPA